MDRRRKIMLAALAFLAVGYLCDTGYRTWYEEPLARAEQQVASLEQSIRDNKLEIRRQENRLPVLDELKRRSLPKNLELAVTAYRSWLLKSLEQSGFTQSNLDSGSPARMRDLYIRIDFSVRTRGTLSQLTSFLHEFYQTDFLHRIRSLTITPTSDGNLDLSLAVEAISIPSVATDEELPTAQDQAWVGPLSDYYVISQRNLFRRGAAPTSNIKLSAITKNKQQQRQAWLSFLSSGETRIVSEGEDLALEGSHLKIQEIGEEAIQIAIDGQPHEVTIGNRLSEPPK